MSRLHNNPNDPNVLLLEIVAARLGKPMLDKLVFVGGSVAGLLITDPMQPAIRPTDDVDLVVQVTGRQGFYALEDDLRALGFVNDMSSNAPICRWKCGEIMMDVVPSDKAILGFANRWYPLGLQTAQPITLPSGVEITAINAPCFCATKLEAFADRGNTSAGEPDYLGSHDMGDFIAVIDGRATLLLEIQQSAPDLRDYLVQRANALVNDPRFMRSVDGHVQPDIVSQLRVPMIKNTFLALAALSTKTDLL
jgi:predicted nucleotidyltransferase